MEALQQHGYGAGQAQGHGTHEDSNKRRADDGPDPPARSKRSRYISIACNECKRRKIKCNGETPCQRCGNMSLECVYAPNCCTSNFRDSEEYRNMNAHIESLQEQVNNLYAHLNALRHEQHNSHLGPQESNSYPPPPQFPSSDPRTYHQDGVSPPQSRGKNHQYQGPTSTAFQFDIANSTLQTMGVTGPEISDGNPVAFDESLADPQLQAPVAPMAVHPSKDPLWRMSKEDAVRLCRIYDDEMGAMYPIINIEELIARAQFLFSFTEAAARKGLVRTDLAGTDSLGTADNNILKMVLATALTVEANGQSDLGKALFDSVKEPLGDRLWEPADLKGLTLSVITAQYHFHIDDEVRAYRLIGHAARGCLEMGLHRREILAKTLLSTEERFQACKLFWSIYVLDRRWSFGTGMPFAIQDADIDPQLAEPAGNPYLTAMIPYTQISTKVWYTVTNAQGADGKSDNATIKALDQQLLHWQKSLPEDLQYHGLGDSANNGGPSKTQKRIQVILYLRANQMRIFLYRPILYSATSIMENRQHAQTVVDIAKDTVRVLTLLNQESDIYRTQQVCFNYFIISALAVLFLAMSHAPAEFSSQVRDEFCMTLDLVKGFSTQSYVSKRLWKTIKRLKEIGPKLGLPRQALADANDPHSSAAVAMAGLAGHRVDEMTVFSPSHSASSLGSAPLNGQQMSVELTNLFEVAGGYPADSMNGYANTPGGGKGEGMSAIYGNDGEFSKIVGELF